jgi:hypothetical protein
MNEERIGKENNTGRNDWSEGGVGRKAAKENFPLQASTLHAAQRGMSGCRSPGRTLMLISSPEGFDLLLLPGRHLSVARHAISFLPYYYYYCRPSRRHSSSARRSMRLSVRLQQDSLSTRSEKNLPGPVTRNLTDPLNGPRQCSWGRGEPRGRRSNGDWHRLPMCERSCITGRRTDSSHLRAGCLCTL